MAVPIVTGTSYNQEIQRSDRSVTQDAKSITVETSDSTTVRSGGSRTIVVPPSSTTNAISPSQEVRAVVPSLSTSAAAGAPTRQQKVASPAAKPVAPKSAPPTRQQQAAPSKQETSPRGAKINDADRVKEAAITAKRQAALKAEISQIRAGSGTALEKQKKINEVQKKSAAEAQRRANDTLDVRRYNRVTPHTQETILNRSERLQRLEAQGRIARPSKTDKNTKPVKGKPTTAPEFPKPSTEGIPPGLEGVVNQNNRSEIVGQNKTQVFDINSFRSEIINNDVLPSHSYLVTFSPFRLGFFENIPLTDFVINKRNTLVMRCENVVLPTPSLLEEENIRRYGYGPVEKIPYGVQFSDVAMTWLVDKKADIIDFMHQWMNTIVMHDSPNANMKMTDGGRKGLEGYNPFEVGYKDGYSNPIVRIYVYDRTNATVTEYELFDVFPMNIQSINLGWADENQVQKLTVNFAYTNMRVKAPQKTTYAQFNYMEGGMSSPYEERKQPDDRGGKAAADRADSPIDEIAVSSVNASKPYSYESEPQTLNLGTPATLTLTTRELTP